jgi:CBS domain-containing protein
MATTIPPNGTSSERRDRRPEVAPPGSAERAESDVTGWSPERDEDPSARQGRYHREAQLRMAQVRDDVRHQATPYGRDDRSDSVASGLGTGDYMGEHDTPHSLERPHPARDYRSWDRKGYGGEEWRHSRGSRQGTLSSPRSYSGPHEEPRGAYTEPREREAMGPPVRAPASEGYSSVIGMGQPVHGYSPTQEPGERRGRWKREPLSARDLMTRNVRTARRDSYLRDVARIMRDEDCGIVPVVDEQDRLVGVITDRDIVLRAFTGQQDPDRMRAEDVMTEDIEAVTPEESIHGVISLMGRRQVRRVPVVERDDRLVGIIAMADIATRADNDEELQEALDRISARRSFWSRWF